MNFLIIGNVKNYTLKAENVKHAWDCALTELKFNITKNKKVVAIKPLIKRI